MHTQVESKLYTTRGVSTRTWVRRWIFLVTFCSTQSKWQSLPSPSRFDTAAVNNERRTILLEADDVFQNKYEVVFDLLHETAYQGCGLGLTILGPESNIKKITRDDLFDYVHTHYTAPRVVVAGAGSINHQDLVAMAEKTFGHLPVKPTNGVIVPPLTKQFTSSIKTLVVGEAARTHLRMTSTPSAPSRWRSRRRAGRTQTRWCS